MYQVENTGTLLRLRSRAAGRRSPAVARNVVLIGLVSLLTDISSEMVTAVLPLYLVLSLGASPLQFGIVDGLYQGVTAIVRVASGLISDRWRRHKEVAAAGYGLSAACKLGLLAVGGAAGGIVGVVLADRVGKGIRTSPRDALISLSSSPATVATAFGVHRAMDTAGAMLGPLIAFGLLSLTPGAFDAIFVVSFCFALLGLAVLVLFVENQSAPAPAREKPEPIAPASAADVARLLGRSGYRRLVIAGGLLGLVTISDAFLYLGLQRKLEFTSSLFPLLAVGTALVYMLLAVPFGRLADRVGRGRVFCFGYGLLLLAYGALLTPAAGDAAVLVALALLGAFYAATDGVLMALAAPLLPAELRASGLGLLVTSTSLGRLGGSIAFGAVWTVWGLHSATLAFGAALALVLLGAVTQLARREPVADV
jgi:MFS family permease